MGSDISLAAVYRWGVEAKFHAELADGAWLIQDDVEEGIELMLALRSRVEELEGGSEPVRGHWVWVTESEPEPPRQSCRECGRGLA